ncbi:nuclear transport factor 2 family protein [Sedimentitalea arenosa]|jgi:hypothetical protein|uniref:Nuclear transport factor 2 family protein n=1 Tax=Sedimentitalea arenosa TaxID=2798803 RepID=A0A8J7J9G3_9RHOB|nr:nuclear transport factor 2 family protein [Arenibacterium arenosum]MBJ6371483.1 nuclear transport factor 2 family protein [Arenibacterium arenosum]
MIRPSSELLAVSRRWFVTVMSREKTTMRKFLSAGDHFRFIGTAEEELWSGPATHAEIAEHFTRMPAIAQRDELLAEAFEAGNIGWSFCIHKVWFEGREAPLVFRATLVFARESGSWKIAQRHASFSSPNDLYEPDRPADP